jgi:hypothetical protein
MKESEGLPLNNDGPTALVVGDEDIKPGDWLMIHGQKVLVTSTGTAITFVANEYDWRYMRAKRGFWKALLKWPFTRRKARNAKPFIVGAGRYLTINRTVHNADR